MNSVLEVGSCIIIAAAIAVFVGAFSFFTERIRFENEFFGVRSMAIASVIAFSLACLLVGFWYMIGLKIESAMN